MDFDLPKEAKLVKRTVRDFAEAEVAPLVETMEETGRIPCPAHQGRWVTLGFSAW